MMGKIKLNEIYISEISTIIQLFDISMGIKIPFFGVSVAIEPGYSLLTVRYHDLFDIALDHKILLENAAENYSIFNRMN